MKGLLRAALFALPVVFFPPLLGPFEAPKAALARTLGAALLVLVLARPDARRTLGRHPLDLAVAAWLAVEALATAYARAPLLSLFGEQQQHEGLFTSLGLAGLYAGARVACADRRDGRAALMAWLAGAALASVYALAQVAHLDPVRWGVAPSFGGVVRPFGSLGHANLMGAVTAPATAAAVALALAGPRRALHWTAAALFAATTLLTLSRGAWLGMAAGAAASVWLVGRQTGFRPTRRMLVIGGAVVVALAALAVAGGWARPFIARFRELLAPVQGSGSSRLEIWKLALALWRDRPLLGQGPDMFALISTQFQTPALWRAEWGGVADHAHSIYLHTLATRGALGFAAGAAVPLALVVALRRPSELASEQGIEIGLNVAVLVAIAVLGAFGALGITGAAIVATTLGMLAASTGTERASAESVAPRRPARPQRRGGPAPARSRASWVFATLAALGVVWWSVREGTMSNEMHSAQVWMQRITYPSDAESQRVYAAMTLRCQRVENHVPFDDWAPRTLSTAEFRWSFAYSDPASMLDDAARDAREAIRRVPLRAVNHRVLGDALAARASFADTATINACDAAFRRASELSPSDPMILVEWARVRLLVGRPADALVLARRVTEFYPTSALAHEVLAESYLATGDEANARASLARARAGEWHGDSDAMSRADLLGQRLRIGSSAAPDSVR